MLFASLARGGLQNYSVDALASRINRHGVVVRDVTPAGSFGKVFGGVTSGFNVADLIAPLIFGAVMDARWPQAVFILVAALVSLAF